MPVLGEIAPGGPNAHTYVVSWISPCPSGPSLFVSMPVSSRVPPHGQFAPGASTLAATSDVVPGPLHTYEVPVTSPASSVPAPSASIPTSTFVPPVGQFAPGASELVVTSAFAPLPPDGPAGPSHAASTSTIGSSRMCGRLLTTRAIS